MHTPVIHYIDNINHSTDFEVHRNWLAITFSRPLEQWYYEKTSEWTLDYPPFFAWFEYFLAKVAYYFDKDMLRLENLNYASEATVLFQRLSVIVTDFILVLAVNKFCNFMKSSWTESKSSDSSVYSNKALVLSILILCNFGLLIVDHIHFQYNGFMFGILIWSMTCMLQNQVIWAAIWFAVLLNFKHIYLYIAPAYFIYLLRHYCFKSNDGSFQRSSFSPFRLISLGLVVIYVFALSFGPFLYLKQVPQVLSRLFPFKRGLCHAYWAPNFWALYNFVDKVLTMIGSRLHFTTGAPSAVMTGGLVQEFHHVVLPSVPPVATLIATLLSIVPVMYHMWVTSKGPESFVRATVLCAFGSYLFGWHVHEKAILLIILPLCLLVFNKKEDASIFLILSTTGHYSLFPLLFTQAETMTKIVLMLTYSVCAFSSLGYIYNSCWNWKSLPLLNSLESVYIIGLIPLELWNSAIFPLFNISKKFPFLPLMLISVYCSVGVIYSWVKFYKITLLDTKMKSQ
ncbi:probable dolichyl pyrophosphate Glc1Man9GlcNAc2 alpha-1,3-glucosyltransferase isoform X2 [Ostrea edulis]|uniref:probable dolichyl pyrophosphate Glc1Man9GlcNAc2 alpha-1,3-glucosyltransferase isoform X2 n=1 Tax=Ostrea edulis TaxID=37623 RepID=UPI0024AEED54|nr:probable dolichyl pyrophosphate Glc1Man9GlcNAc2 alpha-1,3-glucosyltransferase isoform X2 [Ostrea edulis]